MMPFQRSQLTASRYDQSCDLNFENMLLIHQLISILLNKLSISIISKFMDMDIEQHVYFTRFIFKNVNKFIWYLHKFASI